MALHDIVKGEINQNKMEKGVKMKMKIVTFVT